MGCTKMLAFLLIAIGCAFAAFAANIGRDVYPSKLAQKHGDATFGSPNGAQEAWLFEQLTRDRVLLAQKEEKIAFTGEIGRQNGQFGAYEDALVRLKFFPMAAASYGAGDGIIQQCLNNSFGSAQLHRHVTVPCHGSENACAAFIATSHDHKAIILAFRGTSRAEQLLNEFYAGIWGELKHSLEGKVNGYFDWLFWEMVETGRIMEDLQELLFKHGDYDFWITGHSLGGALASIAAAHLSASPLLEARRIKLVTFGQPRTGDEEWSRALGRRLSFHFRVTHRHDVVVHMPLLRMGYQHHANEIFYDNDMATPDFEVCAGRESIRCANKYIPFRVFTGTLDHVNYFGKNVASWGSAGCP